MTYLQIKVTGIEKLRDKFGKFSESTIKYLQAAGQQSFMGVVLKERGTPGNYPPGGAGNKPPTPFYIRGRGTQTASGNLLNSERLGTRYSATTTKIYNVNTDTHLVALASYAHYVVGTDQAKHMARIGWRKLWDVTVQNVKKITAIYQLWVNKALKDAGLIP